MTTIAYVQTAEPRSEFHPTQTNRHAELTFRLIDLLTTEPRVWTLAQLAARLDDSEDKVQRLLNTGEQAGWWVRTEGDGYLATEKIALNARQMARSTGKLSQEANRRSVELDPGSTHD